MNIERERREATLALIRTTLLEAAPAVLVATAPTAAILGAGWWLLGRPKTPEESVDSLVRLARRLVRAASPF